MLVAIFVWMGLLTSSSKVCESLKYDKNRPDESMTLGSESGASDFPGLGTGHHTAGLNYESNTPVGAGRGYNIDLR